MDFRKWKMAYYSMSYDERKTVVLSMLSWLLWKEEIFDNIYNYINDYPEQVTQEDLDQVFESINIVLIQESDKDVENSIWKLKNIQDRLKIAFEQEKKEKQSENIDFIVFDY